MAVFHKDLVEGDLHVPGYVQDTDPGAVGAGILWVDTSASPPVFRVRNSADDGWDVPAAGGEGEAFLLQREVFSPGSIADSSTVSSAFSDVAGIDVTFTAPPSGQAYAVVNGLARVSWDDTTAQAANYHWGVREGSSLITAGEGVVTRAGMGPTTGSTSRRLGGRNTLMTGIESGLVGSVTWKLSHRLVFITGTAATGMTEWGGTVGPLIFEIWGIP